MTGYRKITVVSLSHGYHRGVIIFDESVFYRNGVFLCMYVYIYRITTTFSGGHLGPISRRR